MFIQNNENYRVAKDFWQGKPSEKLFWHLDAGGNFPDLVEKAGYESETKFIQKELGCLVYGSTVDPTKTVGEFTEVTKEKQGDVVLLTYKCSAGILTQKIAGGQIIKHKVNNADELKILIEMWKNIKIFPDIEKFYKIKEELKGLGENRWPLLATSEMSSAIQHVIQRETSVENFWYLMLDHPALVEEALEIWQNLQQRKYDVMATLECEGFYQSENTSTTLISPEYYQKYSLKHMKQFSSAAKKAGVKSMVHMCGLLKDLMPHIKETGITGIHALSPPPIGNTDFEYAYDIMPKDFFALGRFGSLHWIGRNRQQILEDLSNILPHNIYKEHPFVLLVTSDEADLTLDDLYRVRDCINEYENHKA